MENKTFKTLGVIFTCYLLVLVEPTCIFTFPRTKLKTGSGALGSSRTSFRCHRRRLTMSNPFFLLWNLVVKAFEYSQPSFDLPVSSGG